MRESIETKRLRYYLIFAAIVILCLAGAFCWQVIEAEENKNFTPAIKREYLDRPIYIEKEVEVEKTVIETVIVTEFVEVPPADFYFYMENYFAKQTSNQEHWTKCSMEYPEATIIWLYLTETCGYSNYVTAGIMGNLMNETGGNTLNLHPLIYGGSTQGYYGICQWSLKYHPKVEGFDLIAQLEYLADTIPDVMNNSGAIYARGFNYEIFCGLTDSCSAALAFMKVYERPSPASTTIRQMNALKAYQYFVINY